MADNKTKRSRWALAAIALTCATISAMAGCSAPSSDTKNYYRESDSQLTLSSGPTNRTFTISELARSLPLAGVTVHDPVFGNVKHYEGFWLEDVLRFAGIDFSGDNVLVFSALDGYQARLTKLPQSHAKPLIAVRDLDFQNGWEFFMHGKEKITPAPFYLVWQTSAKSSAQTNASAYSLPWPYQISHIELRPAVESKLRLFPKGAESRPDVLRGFDTFSKSCIACHSINLEGGVLGPELNIPKNITEYRDRHYLIEFIKDPSSFRAKSKMPSFNSSFSDDQIENVLNYLGWMREHKVPLTP
jgi:mono/diheme cytochrome c family protein